MVSPRLPPKELNQFHETTLAKPFRDEMLQADHSFSRSLGLFSVQTCTKARTTSISDW